MFTDVHQPQTPNALILSVSVLAEMYIRIGPRVYAKTERPDFRTLGLYGFWSMLFE